MLSNGAFGVVKNSTAATEFDELDYPKAGQRIVSYQSNNSNDRKPKIRRDRI